VSLYERRPVEVDDVSRRAVADLLATARKIGAAEVRIEFHGSGDEGGIQDIYYSRATSITDPWNDKNKHLFFTPPREVDEQISQAADAFTYQQEVGYDDAGGGGFLVVNVPEGTVLFHHYWNSDETSPAHPDITITEDGGASMTDLVLDAVAIRLEAERIIGEDRVPTDILRELVTTFGDGPDIDEED